MKVRSLWEVSEEELSKAIYDFAKKLNLNDADAANLYLVIHRERDRALERRVKEINVEDGMNDESSS